MTAPAPSASGPTALGRVMALDPAAFARDHWDTAPLVTRAADLPGPYTDLFSSAEIDRLVGRTALRQPFFTMVRDGKGLPAATRQAVAGSRTITDLVDPDAVARAYGDGATLVLQSLHRLSPAVGELCRGLAAELGHPTQCNAYITPAGDARGFDFHHDTHDVFVLQVEGSKRWLIHPPVLTLPTKSQPRSGEALVPAGQQPLLDLVLEAGDALYLPRGFVHAAQTTSEASVHLTIGIVATTWYDVLRDVVTSLAPEELELRRALPVHAAGPPSPDAAAADLLKRAADWLASLDPVRVADLVAARVANAETVEPATVMTRARAAAELTAETVVRPRAGIAAALAADGDRVVLTSRVATLRLPAVATALLTRAVAGSSTVADLVEGDPVCDVADALVVVRRLLREGVLVAGG